MDKSDKIEIDIFLVEQLCSLTKGLAVACGICIAAHFKYHCNWLVWVICIPFVVVYLFYGLLIVLGCVYVGEDK